MSHFALGLAPDGSLSLALPSGRTLEFTPNIEALRLIERILIDHAETPDAVKPTQWQIDAMLRDAKAKRIAETEAERAEREAAKLADRAEREKAKAKQARRALKRATGIDVTMLKIAI